MYPEDKVSTIFSQDRFIEENNEYKLQSRAKENHRGPRRGPPLQVMQYWGASSRRMPRELQLTPPGYKFETLSTLPRTWDETSREFIENRENHIVNNKEQYCSVVRTGIGKTVLCLGGEVDASTFAHLPSRNATTAS
jgi:RAT1-interacting protein